MSKLWQCDYKHDRRKHRHRCFVCSKILTEGEPALMVKIRKRTAAIHLFHADEPNFRGSTITWREAMQTWK